MDANDTLELLKPKDPAAWRRWLERRHAAAFQRLARDGVRAHHPPARR